MRRKESVSTLELTSAWHSASPCVGRVVSTSEMGDLMVDFPGNPAGPTHARVVGDEAFDKPNQAVLLIFEHGDLALPIIIGLVRERPKRESIVVEAKKEITLVCGKSSVTLHSDGRVVIKGSELLTRATGTNRIRGASVQIN